jgi:methanogenic corrinoid protein MtbC1
MDMGWDDELRQAVLEGDEIRADEITMSLLKEGEIPLAILEKGAVAGIYEAGRLWQEGTYFLPDIILATEAYNVVSALIEPLLQASDASRKGKVLIGSVEGDAHEIGKNIVIALLRCASYEVFDLGIDVRTDLFLEKVRELQPDLLGLGAYMTTTMRRMGEVVEALSEAGLRDGVKVIVGGAAVTADFSESIGADGYGKDAAGTVLLVDRLMGVG